MPDKTQNPNPAASGGAIEMPPESVRPPLIDFAERLPAGVGGPFAKVLREQQVNAHYEKELADKGIDTYEELAKHYKALRRETSTEEERQEVFGDLRPNSAYIHVYDKANLKSKEYLDTTEELKEAVKGLMKLHDEQNAHYQQLEAQYHKELEGLKTYDQLAEYYKALFGTLNDRVFSNKGDFERTNLKSFEHLDTTEELKRGIVYLLEERDHTAELFERYNSEIEGFDTYEKLAEHYQDLWKEVNKGLSLENYWEWKDLRSMKEYDSYWELQLQTLHLMEERDSKLPVPENHPAAPGGEIDVEDPVLPLPNFQASGMPVESSFMDSFQGMPGIRDAGKAERDQFGIKNSETETPPDSSGHPLIGSFEDFPGIEDAFYREENYEEDLTQEETQNQTIDTQNMQGDAPVHKEAQEKHQAINTQEQQSTSEAAPEQSVPSTENQWSIDQDELVNLYEDGLSPIPKDELPNLYEDDHSSIPEDQLLNPYEDDPVVDPWG